jgi:hypothetical protein
MKKSIYISLAFVVLLFAAAERSYACSCVASPAPVKKQVQAAFTGSTAVFSGEAVEIRESATDKNTVLVRFKATQSWKGEFMKEITIATAKESSMCGYSFEVGKKYLIYANGSKVELSVDNCSRTTGLTNNGDVKYLAKLKQKKPASK